MNNRNRRDRRLNQCVRRKGCGWRQDLRFRLDGLRKLHLVTEPLGIIPEAGFGAHADELAVVRSPDPFGTVAATPEFVAVVFAVFGVTGVDGQHRSSHFSGIFRLLGNSVKIRVATVVQNAAQKSPWFSPDSYNSFTVKELVVVEAVGVGPTPPPQSM